MPTAPIDDAKPLVSVVIPTFNQPSMLCEAVDSVLAQTYPQFEIVVVDDGSAPETRRRMDPYVAAGRLRYLWQENRRQAAARNAGIRASRGELIAFLDHDDLWHPRKLELQVPLFADSQVALVYAGAQEIDETGRVLWTKGLEHFARGDIFDRLLSRHFITHSSVVVRRSALATTGLFRADLSGVDDIHLWLRICRRFKADYVPDVLVSCRNHAGNMKKSDVINEKQHLLALDIFREFGLDRERPADWRRLNADYEFFLGFRESRSDRRAAFAHYLNAARSAPRARTFLAMAKLLVPGYYALADRLRPRPPRA